MSGYSFEISGIDELINQIERTRINFPRDLQKLIEKHGGKLLRDTKMKTPVDTGQLRRSWELEKEDLYIRLYNNVEYAQFIEWGHRTKGGKSYVEGVYMLKTSFEKAKKNFEEDLENLFKKYGFK